MLLTFIVRNHTSPFLCIFRIKLSGQSRSKCSCFVIKPVFTVRSCQHPLSVVRDYLQNIFAATLHIGGRSSIRNLRTSQAVEIGTLSSRRVNVHKIKNGGSSEISSLISAMPRSRCYKRQVLQKCRLLL